MAKIPYFFELSPCGQNWRQVPHWQGSPPSITEFGGSLQLERSSGRGLDRRTHRADSHCDQDDGIRLDKGESRLEQGGDTWGLGEPEGDGYERALHRLGLLRLRERPLQQGVVMPCPLRALV